MTDEEWIKLRDTWKTKVKDNDLRCNDNMIPHTLDVQGVPWTWVSRAYVERMQKLYEQAKLRRR